MVREGSTDDMTDLTGNEEELNLLRQENQALREHMNTIPTPAEYDIQAALEQLSRDDMLALIQRMVQQHPDLAGLIVSKQSTAIKKPLAPFNAEVYRLQVEKIFYTTDRNTWGSEARAAGPLQDIVDISDE